MTVFDGQSDPETPHQGEQQDVPSKDDTYSFPHDTSPGAMYSDQRDASFWIGRTIGRYDVTGVLGIGGMGVVLKAHDDSIGRDVAIKLLPKEMSADANALARFQFEAKSAGRLNHPNTITIHEIGEDAGTHFLVMEMVSGGSAESYLETNGVCSVLQATRMVIEACRGLIAAHETGLIHRDVKPSNLLLAADGSVKLSDFGLAKRTRTESLQKTQVGDLIGTPHYMSPEQCQAQAVQVCSDVYSLGATYYALLTGRSPYADTEGLVQVMFAHCTAPVPDVRDERSDVPDSCARIIQRAMAKQPADRYASASEMLGDLESALAESSAEVTERPPSGASVTGRLAKGLGGRRMLRRSAVLSVASGVLLLLGWLAIFSGSDGTNPPSKDAATASAEQVPEDSITPASAEPIRVGILHSLTGTMADSERPVNESVYMAIGELNRDGGLLGRPVEAVAVDGRSDSETFQREAERLIVEEQVCTVFGCWTSASRKTVVPVFEKLDHLLIYPVQYEGIEESPNVIYLGATPNQQIIPAIKWAYAFLDKRRFFIVGSDYVFPRVASEIIKDQLKELNAELVAERFVPLGAGDIGGVAREIAEERPDIILNLINGDSNTVFFRELHKQGITSSVIPTVSFSIGESELQHLDASKLAGDYVASNYFQSIEGPENEQFVKRFKTQYGPHRVVTDPMEAAYFGVKLWAQAVRKSGSTVPTQIRDAMRNERIRSPGGEVRIEPATQHTFRTPRIGRIQSDGQFEIIWIAARPEQPMPFPASRTPEQWSALLDRLYKDWGQKWSARAVK